MGASFSWTRPVGSGAWAVPVNWTLANGIASTVAPGAADTVTINGGGGTAFKIVAGPGAAAQLSMPGNNALDGAVTTGTLSVGEVAAVAGLDNSDALDIDRGAVVQTGSYAAIYSNIEVDGGSLQVGGGFDVIAGANDTATGALRGDVVVVNGGTLRAQEITLAQGRLIEDGTATVEVGTVGGAALGGVTVDAGGVLTLKGGVTLAEAVTDNGTLVIRQTGTPGVTVSGAVSGSGVLDVQASAQAFVTGGVSGLQRVHVGQGAGVNFVNASITSVGAVQVDANASLTVADLTRDGTTTVGVGGALTVGGTISGPGSIAVGGGSVLTLSGQDVDVPIDLGTRGNVALNLSAGSNIGGAVTGFDSSDLIENRPTASDRHIINQATWVPGTAGGPGTLTLYSGTTAITTIALAGGYAGQEFLTNFTGIGYGNSDVTLPGAVVNGIGPGTQTVTGQAGRSFALVRGGGSPGALTLTANVALEGAYAASSLLAVGSANGIDDRVDIQADSSLTVSGNAAIQTHLQLTGDGSVFTAGGLLTLGGGAFAAEPQVILAGTSRLRAANLTISGSANAYAVGSNSVPDLAVLGDGAVEVGGGSIATAGTLAVDAGATLALAIDGGEIVARTVIDNGVITMRAPSQGGVAQSSMRIAADVVGTGVVQAYGSLLVDGGVSGVALVAGPGSSLTVSGAVSGLQSLSIGASSSVSLYSLSYAQALEVGASASLTVGGLDGTGVASGLASLTVDAKASATFTGSVSGVGGIGVGAGGTLEFDKGGSGSGVIALGSGAKLREIGTLAGWGGLTLAGSNVIATFGGDVGLPVVTGFDTSDQFNLTSGTVTSGGLYYTGATWTQDSASAGTLALTQDGQAVQSYQLAGDYRGRTFLTYAGDHVLGTGVGTSVAELSYGAQTGLSGTTVAGFSGGSFLLLGGTGTQSALALTSNVAVTGQFQLGSVQFGTVAAPAATSNAVLIEQGGVVAAGSAGVNDVVEVDGPGARLSVDQVLAMRDTTGSQRADRLQRGRHPGGRHLDFGRVRLRQRDVCGGCDREHRGRPCGRGWAGPGHGGCRVDVAYIERCDGEPGPWDGAERDLGRGQPCVQHERDRGGDVEHHRVWRDGQRVGLVAGGRAAPTLRWCRGCLGLASVGVSGGGGLTVSSNMLGIGVVTVGAGSGVKVSGIGPASFSAGTLTLQDAATNAGGASFAVDNDATGSGALQVGAHDSFSAGGTVSGWTSIVSGAFASLGFDGAEQATPITMGANSALRLGAGATVSGVVNGFAKGDIITYGTTGAGGPIITDASWTAGAGGLGTLTLSDDGAVVTRLTLAGNYANQRFLTNYAGEPNLTVISLADAPPYVSPDPLFDAGYYLANNPDVAAAGVDPYQHYLASGWKEGRNPSALFNTAYYEQHNPDVAAAGVNPLVQFEQTGWREGRSPSAGFDTTDYLAANPDVRAAGVDPLLHYVQSGRAEGRAAIGVPGAAPDALVNAAYIYAVRPDVAAAGQDASQWFDAEGWTEGVNPDAAFDTNFYLAQNPDVRAAGVNPALHFLASGWREGREPSLVFSDAKYLAANPDVAAAGVNPLLHYLSSGQGEGRAAFLPGGTAPADPLVNAGFYDRQLGATLIPTGLVAAQQAAASYAGSGWMRGLNPDAFFDTAYYLSHNPDVAAARVNPLAHFEASGWREGRDASAQFSTAKYLAAYADVRAAGVDPLLHYVASGQAEGRQAFHV